ncbi:hypothetical protein SDC9_164571 [bioreactor metagenome]|uniref:Uncharacterized protein n=1 Tax=bioreactor metagenome TaxID=1076179 RepID=A0A645FS16_9ZZZZ
MGGGDAEQRISIRLNAASHHVNSAAAHRFHDAHHNLRGGPGLDLGNCEWRAGHLADEVGRRRANKDLASNRSKIASPQNHFSIVCGGVVGTG